MTLGSSTPGHKKQRRSAPGSTVAISILDADGKARVAVKDDRAYLPLSRSAVVGPKATKLLVLPVKIGGDGIQGLVPVLQVRDLLTSVCLSGEGTVRIQLYNSSDEAKILSPRLRVAAVIRAPDSRFVIDRPEALDPESLSAKVNHTSVADQAPAGACGAEYWENKYLVVFSRGEFGVGSPMVKLTICHREIEWLKDAKEIPLCNRGRQYETGDVSEKEASAVIADLHQRRVIRPVEASEKVFLNPIIWVRKTNGKARKTVDFRLLNAYCRTWKTQMPGVYPTISSIPDRWDRFTVLDLDSGFFNIPVCGVLQSLFGFEHRGRRWTYRSLPMGWSCSPSLFLSRLQAIFQGAPATIYQDDILVGGQGQKEHDDNLDRVLSIMADHCLRTNREKMQFCRPEVTFLGYDVKKSTFGLDSYVRKQCSQLPVSTSKRQLQKIIGILNVCRPSCYKLAEWLEPLQRELRLPRKDRSDLSTLQAKTREVWRKVLQNNVRVHRQTTDKPIDCHLYVDWSGVGIGYALFSGTISEGRLISLNSCRETKGPSSSMLGELRGLCWALEQVKVQTAGTRVILWTDSQSAYQCVMTTPKKRSVLDVRVSRLLDWLWSNFPIPSRLEVRHLPGASNTIADTLSRWPLHQETSQTFLTEQQTERIRTAHEGHWNPRRTWEHLKRDGSVWPSARADVEEHVRRCEGCQRGASPRLRDEWRGIECPVANHMLFLDYLGPIKLGKYQKQNKHILAIVDGLTRFCQLTITTHPNEETVIKALTRWWNATVVRHGGIEAIFSDQGQAFCGRRLRAFCTDRQITHYYSPTYTAHTNGRVERLVGNIKTRVKKMAANQELPIDGKRLENIINDAVHGVTKFTPNELFWGVRRGGERIDDERLKIWRSKAIRNCRKAREATTKRSRRRLGAATSSLRTGSQVLVYYPEAGRGAAWRGPFMLAERIGRCRWNVLGHARNPVHSSRIKEYHE